MQFIGAYVMLALCVALRQIEAESPAVFKAPND